VYLAMRSSPVQIAASGRKPSAPFVHFASALRTCAAAPQALTGGTGHAHARHLRPAIRTREAPEIDAPSILDNRPVDDEASTEYKKSHHDQVNRRLHRDLRSSPPSQWPGRRGRVALRASHD
jgi:hypothetical protein